MMMMMMMMMTVVVMMTKGTHIITVIAFKCHAL
jgi:hypothetical protein